MPTNPTPWPYNHTDPVRAIHLADDPECPYNDASRCPDEAMIRRVLARYETWASHQPTPKAAP